MLRINLIPGYVAQNRLTKKLVVVFGLVVVAVGVALMSYVFAVRVPYKDDIVEKANTAKTNKDKAEALKSQTGTVAAATAPIQAKLDFITAVHEYNTEYPKLYATLAKYADPKVIYTDATVNGTTMAITAHTPSIAETGRYLLTMYKEPDFASVNIDHLPGYPEAVVTKYYLNGHLIGIDSSGSDKNFIEGLAKSAAPTLDSTSPNSGFGPKTATTAGAYGSSLLTDTDGDTLSTIQQVLAGSLNPLASPEQRNRQYRNALKKIQVTHEPKGFTINVTAILKHALNPPALPGTGGSPANSGPAGTSTTLPTDD